MALNKLPYSRKLNQAQTRKGINFPPLEGKVGKCSVCKSLQECPKAFVCNFLSLIRSRQQFVKHSHLTPTAHRPLAQMSTLDTNSQTGTGRNSAPAPFGIYTVCRRINELFILMSNIPVPKFHPQVNCCICLLVFISIFLGPDSTRSFGRTCWRCFLPFSFSCFCSDNLFCHSPQFVCRLWPYKL